VEVTISSVIDNGNGTVKVAWSDATPNAEAREVNSPVTIPEGLVGEDGSVIMAEVTYNYTSPMGFFFQDAIEMNDVYYLHPRKVEQITRQASCS
jgi:hypothetical protein